MWDHLKKRKKKKELLASEQDFKREKERNANINYKKVDDPVKTYYIYRCVLASP